MTFIHENPAWTAFQWDDRRLSQVLHPIRFKQGSIIGQMRGLGFDLRQEASLKTLIEDVVKTSAIEGETLNPAEVRSSLARRLGMDAGGLPPAGRDVEGIVEVMLDATQNYDQPLTQERLFDWHAALFPTGRSGMRKIAVGGWRTKDSGPMQVVSGPVGRETVHFVAPAAGRLQAEMTRFLDWYNDETWIDPVLKAGVAHFWFVTIHPFEDGNGRLARIIADMALARAEENPQRFYSMSSQIAAERVDYYDRLEAQQRSDSDITDWLSWFLTCFDRALDRAQHTLDAVMFKANFWDRVNQEPVNNRQHAILNRMLGYFEGYMNASKYARMAKCSAATATRDIQDLVARNILVKNPGGGRSTSYRLPKPGELEQIMAPENGGGFHP